MDFTALQTLAAAIAAAIIPLVFSYLKTAEGKETVAAITEYYTEGNTKPPEGVTIPERSIRMNDETKQFITNGESDADKVKMLEQVSKAESEGKTEYMITYSKGYYKVQWGLVYGSARWG